MLSLLIKKEIVSHVLTLRFSVACLLFVALVFASIYIGVNECRMETEQYLVHAELVPSRLKDLVATEDAKEFFNRLTSWDGRLDAVPVAPLSAVARGLSPVTPCMINTACRWWRNFDQADVRDPLLGLFTTPDFTYVVSVIVSLIAILFAFDAIAGEKESGTLRLMLSNSIPRHQVILAKWIGGYMVLITPFLIAVIGGIGYAWAIGGLDISGDHLGRLMLLFLVACLYISTFFSLGIFISTTTHRASTALLTCLTVWTVWTIIIPSLAPVAAMIILPTPSAKKVVAEQEMARTEKEVRKAQVRTSGQYSEDELQRQIVKIAQECDRTIEKWQQFLENAAKRQSDLAYTLGCLSPSGCWVFASTTLMETGPTAYERFEHSRKRLQKELTSFVKSKQQEARNVEQWQCRPEEIPSLKITFADKNHAIGDSLNNTLLLAIANVVFFMLAFMLFLRYDVR